jgi:hypothetical protein
MSSHLLFVSMKKQHRAKITTARYESLLEFESLHPELYTLSYAPRQADGPIGGLYIQETAFERVVSHPVHGLELQKLVESHPMKAVESSRVIASQRKISVEFTPNSRKRLVEFPRTL